MATRLDPNSVYMVLQNFKGNLRRLLDDPYQYDFGPDDTERVLNKVLGKLPVYIGLAIMHIVADYKFIFGRSPPPATSALRLGMEYNCHVTLKLVGDQQKAYSPVLITPKGSIFIYNQ